MNDPAGNPTPPGRLPDSLIERLESLEIPDLKAVLSYVEQRIESLRTPIEEKIRENAAGEVLEIENHGAYALVRKHPPDPAGHGVDPDIVSLYHVRRERQSDDEESLHWAYLGDVRNSDRNRCETCGRRTLEEEVSVCPHCGGDEIDHSEAED